MNKEITPDRLTRTYIKIRTERAALSVQFKEADAKLIRQQDSVKRALLDHCDRHNTESVRTTEGLLPIEDIAKHFSVSISTVRAWVRQKHIPEDTYIKIGSTYRFRVSDVESALTSSKKEVRSQEIEYLNDLPVSDFLDEDQ